MQEAHYIAGEDCFLLKVRTPDAKTLSRPLRERMAFLSSRTTVVLETVREGSQLPLEVPKKLAEEVLDD